MTTTRGRKPLPLPVTLRQGLEAHGFVQAEGGSEPRPWRHVLLPGLRAYLVASNIPGSTMVTASLDGPPRRVEADVVLAELLLRLHRAQSGERRSDVR